MSISRHKISKLKNYYYESFKRQKKSKLLEIQIEGVRNANMTKYATERKGMEGGFKIGKIRVFCQNKSEENRNKSQNTFRTTVEVTKYGKNIFYPNL